MASNRVTPIYYLLLVHLSDDQRVKLWNGLVLLVQFGKQRFALVKDGKYIIGFPDVCPVSGASFNYASVDRHNHIIYSPSNNVGFSLVNGENIERNHPGNLLLFKCKIENGRVFLETRKRTVWERILGKSILPY